MTEVLIIHRYLWPENLSLYPAMLQETAEFHRSMGDEVTVATAAARDPNDHDERHRWATRHGITLVEIPMPVDRGMAIARRVRSMAAFSLFALRQAAMRRYDTVSVASYPQLLTPLLVLVAARIRRKRSLFHVQDILSGRLGQRGNKTRQLGKVIRIVERQLVGLATTVITLSPEMKQTLGGGANIAVLQNFLLDAPPSGDQTPASPDGDGTTFIYAGNLGVAQNLEILIDAVAIAHTSRNVHLRVLGDGSEAPRLRRHVAANNIECVSFEGQVPREQATAAIAAADVGVVAAEPGLFHSAYPSKTLSYLSQGLPVLVMCEPDTSVAHEVERHGLGRGGSPIEADELATAVLEVAEASSQGDFEATRLKDWAEQNYGRDAYFEQYGKIVIESWPPSTEKVSPT